MSKRNNSARLPAKWSFSTLRNHKTLEKHSVLRLSTFSRACIFFLLWSSCFFSSLLWLVPSLLFHLSILSEVWFFNFLRLRHCSMDQTAVFFWMGCLPVTVPCTTLWCLSIAGDPIEQKMSPTNEEKTCNLTWDVWFSMMQPYASSHVFCSHSSGVRLPDSAVFFGSTYFVSLQI